MHRNSLQSLAHVGKKYNRVAGGDYSSNVTRHAGLYRAVCRNYQAVAACNTFHQLQLLLNFKARKKKPLQFIELRLKVEYFGS